MMDVLSDGATSAAVLFPLESPIYLRAKIHHVGVDHKCFPCGLLNPYTDPVLMLNNVSVFRSVRSCLHLDLAMRVFNVKYQCSMGKDSSFLIKLV